MKNLEELMLRAKGVMHSKKKEEQLDAKAIRDSYAPQIADLRRAEGLMVKHYPEAKRVESYAENFPWHLARERGQPADISELLGELRRCTSLGLNGIRVAIEKN